MDRERGALWGRRRESTCSHDFYWSTPKIKFQHFLPLFLFRSSSATTTTFCRAVRDKGGGGGGGGEVVEIEHYDMQMQMQLYFYAAFFERSRRIYRKKSSSHSVVSQVI